MKIVKLENLNINDVINVLKNGGLIIFPTETLYGAMVDATNADAVSKLNTYKQRPYGKPYSIAVNDIKMAEKYAVINETAKKLYSTFLPGPLTIISKGKGIVAKGVESENKTIGIRIPDYPLLLDIIKTYGKPLTATSANASYQKRPYKISDILDNLSEKQKKLIDLIVDAGELPHNEPSTVVDTTLDDTTVLRQGYISFNNEDAVISRSIEDTENTAKNLQQKYQDYINKRSLVFALEGEMGAGKTIFTKGLAKALRIDDVITSPTYDLENTYQGQLGLLHIDAWRIDESEVKDLSFEKYVKERNCVIAIEWADRIKEEILSKDEEAVIIWVKITVLDETTRKIQYSVIS